MARSPDALGRVDPCGRNPHAAIVAFRANLLASLAAGSGLGAARPRWPAAPWWQTQRGARCNRRGQQRGVRAWWSGGPGARATSGRARAGRAGIGSTWVERDPSVRGAAPASWPARRSRTSAAPCRPRRRGRTEAPSPMRSRAARGAAPCRRVANSTPCWARRHPALASHRPVGLRLRRSGGDWPSAVSICPTGWPRDWHAAVATSFGRSSGPTTCPHGANRATQTRSSRHGGPRGETRAWFWSMTW